MRRITLAVSLVALAFCTSCAKDPHKLKITEQNKDNFMESIKDSKGLTVAETRMLIAYQMRNSIGKAFGGNDKNTVGKTVADLITEEERFEQQQNHEQEEQKRLATEAKAKEDALAAELRKAITLSVYEKSFLAADPTAGSYEDHIVIKCAYQNTSGKDIRAFKGKVRFTDLFGSEIYKSSLTISDPVSTGNKATWTGTIKYNQFLEDDVKLRSAELKDMKVEWLPSSVIFADGTKLGEE